MRVIKSNSHKKLATFIAVALLLTTAIPLFRAFADEGYTITVHSVGTEWPLSPAGTDGIQVQETANPENRGVLTFSDSSSPQGNNVGTVNCASQDTCTVTIPNNDPVYLSYYSGAFGVSANNAALSPGAAITSSITLEIGAPSTNPAPSGNDYCDTINCDSSASFSITVPDEYLDIDATGTRYYAFEFSVNDNNYNAENTTFTNNNNGTHTISFTTGEHSATVDPNEKNLFTMMPAFGSDVVPISATINGAEYQISADNNYAILLPGASSYSWTMTADNFEQTSHNFMTVFWSNNDTTDPDAFVEHGAIRAVGGKYNDGTTVNWDFHEDADPNRGRAGYYGDWDEATSGNGVYSSVGDDAHLGDGYVVVGLGSTVDFEIIPDEGYQLTSININGQPVPSTEDQNIFSFTPRATSNVHISATFTAVDNTVNAESDIVSSGSVSIAGGDIDSGSARLDVADVENLSASQITNFEGAAVKAGDYKITNYLDISLYNISYRGNEFNGDITDPNQVWSNQISSLNNEAEITLQLEEGVDGNNIVIVHELHDADGNPTGQYEIIPVTYDAATHTITFKTSSFSNFAIATKATAGTPNTGVFTFSTDSSNSSILPLILGAGVVIILGTVIILRRRHKA